MQSCLDTKADTLNYSYADKRALYLAVLAKALTKSKLFSEVQLAGLRGEVSRPILLARPGVYMCLLLAQPCASWSLTTLFLPRLSWQGEEVYSQAASLHC